MTTRPTLLLYRASLPREPLHPPIAGIADPEAFVDWVVAELRCQYAAARALIGWDRGEEVAALDVPESHYRMLAGPVADAVALALRRAVAA